MKYNGDFKHDLEWGQQGEQVVAEIQMGDKTEVKSERDLWDKSGNHFCEFSSRGKDSGILKTEAKWWTINFYKDDEFIFNITLTVARLKALIEKNKYRKVSGGDNNSSFGYLIPIKDLVCQLIK